MKEFFFMALFININELYFYKNIMIDFYIIIWNHPFYLEDNHITF